MSIPDVPWEDRDPWELERDRRLAEVALEREKALRIKGEADRQALQLAHDVELYKDAKANELREMIRAESRRYVRREEIVGLTPLAKLTPMPTRLEALRAEYVEGEIEVEEFEVRVAVLLASGTADESCTIALR